MEHQVKSEIKKIHNQILEEIEQKNQVFKTIWGLGEDEIKAELVFCICTPQSNAHAGWKAVQELSKKNLLNYYENNQDLIAKILGESGVRFKINKAKYIVSTLDNIYPLGIKYYIENAMTNLGGNIVELRNWLAKFVKGYGMKEASHFLRNIGLGENLAILDRHILRNLAELEVINEIPRHLDKKAYLEIEDKMRQFSSEINIPMFALDFVFWYKAKGELFK